MIREQIVLLEDGKQRLWARKKIVTKRGKKVNEKNSPLFSFCVFACICIVPWGGKKHLNFITSMQIFPFSYFQLIVYRSKCSNTRRKNITSPTFVQRNKCNDRKKKQKSKTITHWMKTTIKNVFKCKFCDFPFGLQIIMI